MAKQVKPTDKNQVLFQTCSLWQESVKEKVQQRPIIKDKIAEFLRTKEENPMQAYGTSDYAFSHILAELGLRHAKLTPDWSLVYSVSGRNPTIIRLYGVFSHDELGTGQPPSIKRQRGMKTQFSNQKFS